MTTGNSVTPSLPGTRALVVGASAGIGREIGLRLAAHGAEVAFHGRRLDRLEDAVALAGGGCAVVADLGDAGACARLVEDAVAHLGGIDVLVIAASASRLGLLKDVPGEEWTQVYATNVIAPALVMQAALPHLSATSVSAFLSSEAVGAPHHGLIPYASSKAALEEVVRGFRVEHPELRVGCIRVGATLPTDFGRDFDPELAGALFPKWISYARLPAQFMDVGEVGRSVADILATALANPTIDIHDLVIRPAGGLMAAGETGLLATIDEVHDSVYGDG